MTDKGLGAAAVAEAIGMPVALVERVAARGKVPGATRTADGWRFDREAVALLRQRAEEKHAMRHTSFPDCGIAG